MSKPASGVFIQPVQDEAGARPRPQRARVYRAIRHAIDGGALAVGDRLPSARQLAMDWGLARGAVDEAFAQLQLEGLIRRRVGDGTYVEPRRAGPWRSARAATPPPPRGPSDLAHHVLAQAARMGLAPGTAPMRLECAFTSQRPPPLHPRAIDIDGFPLALWRRLLAAAASERQRPLLGGAPATGLPALREAVARHVGVMRGVPCRAEQVLVVASPAEGLNLLVRLLMPPGGSMWVEEPTHPTLPSLLESLGARVTAVPLDAQGFDVAEARRRDPGATLAYLHPLGHYPLGRRTTAARGDELLEWARREGRWIVEGHFNDELWPREVQPPALARRDRERVFLLGTFESVMFPSLRLGYLVVPQALVGAFAEAITLWGPRAPAATQWALAEFIDRGHLLERILALRERYAGSRRRVQQLLIDRLPPAVRAEPLTPVPTVCLHLGTLVGGSAAASASGTPADHRRPATDIDWLRRLRSHGLVLEPLSGMHWVRRGADGLVFGYGDWSDAALEAALRRLCRELTAAAAAAPAGLAAAAGGPYHPVGENA
ncbi:MAG: PLP-dependent aminotransferase family protein [Rubrivivax sp.]|nr:PLP-dependent aminotransferase family protein [Rubrivivax sp.]